MDYILAQTLSGSHCHRDDDGTCIILLQSSHG
jgi:hypothetical protein